MVVVRLCCCLLFSCLLWSVESTANLDLLYRDIWRSETVVVAPYELARFAVHQPDCADRQGRAVKRQEALEYLREQATTGDDPRWALVDHAMGRITAAEAVAGIPPTAWRLRYDLARFWLSSCDFERAIPELIRIADATAAGPLALLATDQLLLHHRQRQQLAAVYPVWPLTVDLDGWVAARLRDPQVAARAAAMPAATIGDREDIELQCEMEVEEFGDCCDRSPLTARAVWSSRNDEGPVLCADGSGLFIGHRSHHGWLASDELDFQISSVFHGPLQVDLYRFADQAAWLAADPATVAAMTPAATTTVTLGSLRDNNRSGQDHTVVHFPQQEEGYYLALARAPYAPMIAGTAMAVSRYRLHLTGSAAAMLGVVVDRVTALPVAGQQLRFTVTGQDEAGEERTWSFAATTDEQGCALVRSGLDLPGRHEIHLARSSQPDLAPVSMTVAATDPGSNGRRVLVWAAEPVVRPGSTVALKGVVRQLVDDRWQDASVVAGQTVRMSIRCDKGVLLERSLRLDTHGAFDCLVPVPATAALGDYRVTIDGVACEPRAPFAIQEFRTPTYTVTCRQAPATVARGDQLSGVIDVQYYDKQPAAGTEVTCRIDGTDTLARGRTDDQGRFAFTLPTEAVHDRGRLVYQVIDGAGMSYGGSHAFSVVALPFTCSLNPDTVYQRAQTTWSTTVTAYDLRGQPLAGAAVIHQGQEVQTDDAGRATITGTMPDHERRFPITISHRGSSRELILLLRPSHLWSGPRAWRDPTQQRDHAYLKWRGDWSHGLYGFPALADAGAPITGRYVLREVRDWPQDRQMPVLLTVAAGELVDHRVVMVDPAASDHALEIATEADWAPQAQLTAVPLLGDNLRPATRQIWLMPRQRIIDLGISTDEQDYAPGDQVVATISARNHDGHPVVGCPISIGVVNAGLYAIRPDPLPDLVHLVLQHNRQQRVGIGRVVEPSCRTESWLLGPKLAWRYHQLDLEEELGMSGRFMSVSRGSGSARRIIDAWLDPRQDFRTLAHWQPSVITDARGQATVTFTLPDTIGSWRFTARALSDDNLVGSVRANRISTLPVQVALNVPRLLRAGDRIELPIMVRSDGQRSGTARIAAQLTTPDDEEVAQLVTSGPIDAHRQLSKAIACTVPFASTLTMQAGVELGDQADAVRRRIPISMPGYEISETLVIGAGDQERIHLPHPDRIMPGSLSLTVTGMSGISGVVEESLGSLIDYPYGCVEQTMSRFLPAIIAQQAMQTTGLTSAHSERLPRVMAQGIERLAGFLHDDGGWGWWKDDQTNAFMTAYVLDGLSRCRALGETVPDDLIARPMAFLLDGLRRNSLKAGSAPGSIGQCSLRPWVLQALCASPAATTERAYLLGAVRQELAASTVERHDGLLLAMCLARLGEVGEAKQAQRRFRRGVTPRAGDRGSLLETALVLELAPLLDSVDRNDLRLAWRLVDARRSNASWGDTLCNAAAVRGLAPMIGHEAGSALAVAVTLDGRDLRALRVPANQATMVRFDREIARGRSLAVSVGKGDGRVVVTWRAMFREAPEPVDQPAVRLTTSLQADGAALPVPRGTVRVLRGQRLTYQVTISSETERAFHHLIIPRISGLTFLPPEQLPRSVSAWEDRDDGMHLYLERLPAGEQSYAVDCIAELVGDCFAPPPRLENMYGAHPSAAVIAPQRWQIRQPGDDDPGRPLSAW